MKSLFLVLLLSVFCGIANAAKIADTWTVFGPYKHLDYTLPKGFTKGIPEVLKV
jgi:hypothetical protein